MKIFIHIFVLITLFFVSCTTKIIEVDDATKKICRDKNYNGIYEINLVRLCSDGPNEWGTVKMNVNNCILSVDDLYGAHLYFESDNLDRWKSLTGKIDKQGRISGSVYLKTAAGKEQYANLNFYGNINESYMKARHSLCSFTFNLNKKKDIESNTKKKIEEPKIEVIKKDKIEIAQAIVLPIGVLGEISETKKIIIHNKFMEVVSNDFDLISQEEYERAEEEAFQELDYEECTEDQCIKMIQEILQVENMYKIQLVKDEDNIQVSLTYIDLDKKLVQTDFCEDCKTFDLINMINKLYLDLRKKR